MYNVNKQMEGREINYDVWITTQPKEKRQVEFVNNWNHRRDWIDYITSAHALV